jgi:FtsZ-binding cell division protein ZapB
MNDIVDSSLLFDYAFMREKIRLALNVQDIKEIPDLDQQGNGSPIGLMIAALSQYGIRPYYGFLNSSKMRQGGTHVPLLFYTNTNVKVHISSAGVSYTFTSDDGTISCSACATNGQFTGDLSSLKNAVPYIDPAIYLDYLMCCDKKEVLEIFTKSDAPLAQLREDNQLLMDENDGLIGEATDLMEENIRLSKYNKTLETTNTYIQEENNGYRLKVMALTNELDRVREKSEDAQVEAERRENLYRSIILYLISICILRVLYLNLHSVA